MRRPLAIADAVAPVEDEADRHRAQHRRRAAVVVGLGMGDDQQVEPPHARVAQPRQDRAIRRAGVDEDRAAPPLDQRRVALADIEEGDPQPGGRREPGADARETSAASPGHRRASEPAASGALGASDSATTRASAATVPRPSAPARGARAPPAPPLRTRRPPPRRERSPARRARRSRRARPTSRTRRGRRRGPRTARPAPCRAGPARRRSSPATWPAPRRARPARWPAARPARPGRSAPR